MTIREGGCSPRLQYGKEIQADAQLLERRVDAELPEGGVFLELPHRKDGLEGNLAHSLGPAALPVLQARLALREPPPEHP